MPVHKEYYKILERLKNLVEAKNADYTGGKDPFYNIRYCENFGIPAWVGLLTRITDKWTRMESLLNHKKAKVKNERITDTIDDMINYLIFFEILYEES